MNSKQDAAPHQLVTFSFSLKEKFEFAAVTCNRYVSTLAKSTACARSEAITALDAIELRD